MKEHVLGSLRMTVVMTALLGFVYPSTVWSVGRLAFREEAGGGFLRREEGNPRSGVIGSVLIGQSFSSRKFFHSRPSSAGDSGYDATASGGTNLGPTSRKLARSVAAAVAAVRAENPAAGASHVPADLVTSSASGLDPHISPENARLQAPRVAKATGIPQTEILALVAARTEGRFLGVFGEARVNVLLLNLDVAARAAAP